MADEADDGGAKLTFYEQHSSIAPLDLFAMWLEDASRSELNDPNAMALATVDADGLPDVRMVLLKGFDAHGFTFYTNLQSGKGRQLAAVPKAALLFHWKSLRRQVRVRGMVSPVEAGEADAYFASRARVSRLGAWASQQSRPLAGRAVLEQAVADYAGRYPDDIPRPPHWSGFRIAPVQMEFWQDGAHRLHDRILFRRDDREDWTRTPLFP